MTAYLERRRARVAAAWGLSDEIVLVGAGHPISIPGGQDQTYPFLSHSEYFYLADRECEGGVVAFDPKEGWTDFVPDVTEDERVWEGRTDVEGTPLSRFAAWLAARRGRKVAMLGVALHDVAADATVTAEAREKLQQAIRPKDEVELERMRRATAATAAGFAAVRRLIRPGVTERELQVELETEFFRHGGERTAFGTIVGAGSNSGVLHFTPGDAPGGRRRQRADRRRRRGRPLRQRRHAHLPGRHAGRLLPRALPGRAERAGEAACSAAAPASSGARCTSRWRATWPRAWSRSASCAARRTRWSSRTRTRSSSRTGSATWSASACATRAATCPGASAARASGSRSCAATSRSQPGYVITVEPGLYFIPALLKDPERRSRYRDAVNWAKVDTLLGFGGIRIEDDVLVTPGEPDVLTAAIPKTL